MRTRLITRSRRAAAFGTAFAVAAALTIAGTTQAAFADDTAPDEHAVMWDVVTHETVASAEDAVADAGGEILVDDPRMTMEVDETSEWAIKREGLTVFSWGFTPGATVTVTVGETVLTEDTADADGDLNFGFTAGLTAGDHVIELSSSEGGSVSQVFTVIADDVFYDDEYAGNFDPAIQTSRWVVTESELAAAPIGVTGSGFPNSSNPVGPTTVDVVLDGEIIETVRTDIVGAVSAEISGPLSVGVHEVALVSPVGQAAQTVEVVPDGQGAAPAAGSYLGFSMQTHADGVELDDRDERPFRFEIDAEGRISGIQGEYWWFCAGGSGFKDLADSGFPATALTADRPFEIQWHDYVLHGTVNADGTASGTFWDGMGECGSSILTWSAEFDGELPGPVYDPEATVSPASLTESELADGGVTFTGSGFAPESDVTLMVAGAEVETTAADADGNVTFVFTSDALAAGSHEAVLSSAEGEARVAFTVTEDEPAPETIPGTVPAEGDLDPSLEDGITAPSEARAGQAITVVVSGVDQGAEVGVWLFGSAAYLGTHTVGEAGEVVVTIPASTAVGEHRLGVWTAPDTQLGWTGIVIVDDGDGGGGPDGTGGPGGGGGDGDGGDADGAGSSGAGGDDGGTGGGDTSGGGDLAATGAGDVTPLVGLAALLLAAGAMLLAWRRRLAGQH